MDLAEEETGVKWYAQSTLPSSCAWQCERQQASSSSPLCMPPAAFCSCKPGLRSEVGPGNGNPSPEVWVGFQEQVRDRPGRLEVSRGRNVCGPWVKVESSSHGARRRGAPLLINTALTTQTRRGDTRCSPRVACCVSNFCMELAANSEAVSIRMQPMHLITGAV
jgi:hypothetical protein